MGRDSSVGIETGYELEGPGSYPGGFHLASCKIGTGSFLGWSGRGVMLTTHPLLDPRSRNDRAIPLFNLWACSGLYRIALLYILVSFIISIQPLDRFWQEPEPSQATGMALARCILGTFLGVVCHCFPLSLDVPTFAARCLHLPINASAPSS
jgi:hypothetical protein